MNHRIECPACKSKDYYKNGHYHIKRMNRYYPKYKCKQCGKYFSFRNDRDQNNFYKRELLLDIFLNYTSHQSIRRMALNFREKHGVGSKNTIARYVDYLGAKAREHHERMLKAGKLNTAIVQFDEMEHYINSKYEMVSIVVAVCGTTGRVIALESCEIKCKGKLGATPNGKFINKTRTDKRDVAFKETFRKMRGVFRTPNIIIVSDAKPAYRLVIKKEFGPPYNLTHQQEMSRGKNTPRSTLAFKKATGATPQEKVDDPLFWLNHLCAELRYNVNRLDRKSWNTSKSIEKLQNHLYIFIARHNGYSLEDMTDDSGGLLKILPHKFSPRDFKKRAANQKKRKLVVVDDSGNGYLPDDLNENSDTVYENDYDDDDLKESG